MKNKPENLFCLKISSQDKEGKLSESQSSKGLMMSSVNNAQKMNRKTCIKVTKFWYGNPENEIIEGSVKYNETRIVFGAGNKCETISSNDKLENIKQYIWDFNMDNKYINSIELICTNIKNRFSIHEFLDMIRLYLSYIKIIRVLKSPEPNIYYIFLQFKNAEYTNIFYNTYNYSNINNLEEDYLIFDEVLDLRYDEVYTSSERRNSEDDSNSDVNIIDTTTDKNLHELNEEKLRTNVKRRKFSYEKDLSYVTQEDKQICTICLENLSGEITDYGEKKVKGSKITKPDPFYLTDINGKIHILCGHAFHLKCFSKLPDDKCPLCRYNISPINVSTCEFCGSEKDLWMCLICGNISCGEEFGNQNHRAVHFKESGHVYTQGLGENRKVIFDFVKHSDVQGIIQNSVVEKRSGKVGNMINPQFPPSNSDPEFPKSTKEKTEYIMSEYNSIISSQLESQRVYFLNEFKKRVEKNRQEARDLDAQIKEKKEEFERVEERFREEERKKDGIFGELKVRNSEKKAAESELKRSEDEYSTLVEAKKMREKAEKMRGREIECEIERVDSETKELIEQIKEVKLHIKTKDKIEKNDVQGIRGASLGMIVSYSNKKKNK